MRFIHVSIKQSKLKFNKLKKPTLHLQGDDRISFILKGCIFLSKELPNGSSDWLNWRNDLCENKLRNLSELNDKHSIDCNHSDENGISYDDDWLSSTRKYYFDIDFEKNKIFIVDNASDFIRLFIDYGHFNLSVDYNLYKDLDWKTRSINIKKDELRVKNLINHTLINKFYDCLDEHTKNYLSSEKITILIENRNRRNIKLLKFYKNKIIIPEKGLTHNFLLDVIRTKKYYDNLIGDREDLVNKIKICADTFNFYKMNLDGYKGIYYTENVIKRENIVCSNNNECTGKCIKAINFDISDFLEDIKAPSIFKKIGLEMTSNFKKGLKDTISSLSEWLGSEQMMLWNWDSIPKGEIKD
jgi:hypothetical protein